jgi:phage/plasmid-associated DNA primase
MRHCGASPARSHETERPCGNFFCAESQEKKSVMANNTTENVTEHTDALSVPVSLTLLTVTNGNASKRLKAGKNGLPMPDPKHSLGISTGRVEHLQVDGLEGLRTLLGRVNLRQALVHGIPRGSQPGDSFKLVTAAVKEKTYKNDPLTIARTLDHIDYSPARFVLMFDRDNEAGTVVQVTSAAQLLEYLIKVIPALAAMGSLTTASTSSSIRPQGQPDTWLTPPYGMHTYTIATGSVERFRELLKIKLWCAGLGFCRLASPNKHTGVASILERALVDLMVFSPERLDYVAGALIDKKEPFYQDRPDPELRPGIVLDLNALPDPTDAERQEYARLLEEAREGLRPQQRETIRQRIIAQTPRLSPAEQDAEIRHRLVLAERDELVPDHPLYFGSLNDPPVTAKALSTTAGKAFDKKRLLDPQEPDYRDGQSQAYFHWNRGDWRIVSFAHGIKKIYRLAPPEPPAPEDDDMEHLLTQAEQMGLSPQQAAEALLAQLDTLADDAKENAILDALPRLAGLDAVSWIRLKRQLKTAVPRINLNDLGHARKELKKEMAQAAPGGARGLNQAQLAAHLENDYRETWAFDLQRQCWLTYGDGFWQPRETERINQDIGRYMDERLDGDYTWPTLTGVEHLLRTRLPRTFPFTPAGWLPFRNGALCLETMQLHPHSPAYAFVWQLPHDYNAQATCPLTQAWLHEVVGGFPDQVQLLRAYLKAVITRRVDLERYLEMIGPGGTGKSTYARLLMAVVGEDNTYTTELKHLEANRFETSALRGKVLMLVTDAERWSGPVNQLKAIVGEDRVRMEQKYKDPKSEMAPVMVAIAANEPIQSADYTSGLERRRLSMAFRHRPAKPRELLALRAHSWQGELVPEIPGVINWALALPDADMEACVRHTTTMVPSLKATWAQALVETSPLADWANQRLVHDTKLDTKGKFTATNVGVAKRMDRPSTDYEHQDTWLYANYRAWVDTTGQKPLSQQRFTYLLNDLLVEQLRLEHVSHKKDVLGSRVFCIRLRPYGEKDSPLLITPDTAQEPDPSQEKEIREV